MERTGRQTWARWALTAAVAVIIFAPIILAVHSEQGRLARIRSCDGSRECYRTIIADEMRSHGLREGFRLLASAHAADPDLRPFCLALTYELASDIYATRPHLSGSDIPVGAEVCNYGFPSEYVRLMVVDSRDEERAAEFCREVGASSGQRVRGAEAECFRGVGRALPWLSPTRSEREMAVFAVRSCATLSPNESYRGTCLSGVFSALGRTEERLSGRDTRDPLKLCKLLDGEPRERCFGNYRVILFPRVRSESLVESAQLLAAYYHGVEKEFGSAIELLGYNEARRSIAEDGALERIASRCAELAPELAVECVRGATVGLAKNAMPGEQHLAVLSFCKLAARAVPQLSTGDCPSVQAAEYLHGFYDAAHFDAAYLQWWTVLGVMPSLPRRAFGY